jgi:hypothetical protein
MKKITFLAVAALAVSFASCKKPRTCTCAVTSSYTETHTDGTPAYSSPSTSYNMTSVSTTKLSKKSGRVFCASGKEVETDVTTSPSDTETTVTTTEYSCTLSK